MLIYRNKPKYKLFFQFLLSITKKIGFT
uniref:Uncharacterized protein n=1 Tax=Anguilla anguilla TaxID=7936 RepID=A0A0E9PGG4_ANGAN